MSFKRRIASAKRCRARWNFCVAFRTAQRESSGKSQAADGSGPTCDLGTGLAWRSFNCRGSGRRAFQRSPVAANVRANRNRTAIAAWMAASPFITTTTTSSIRRREMSRRRRSGIWWATRPPNARRSSTSTGRRASSPRSSAVATGSGATSTSRRGVGRFSRPMRTIGGSSCSRRSRAADRPRRNSCFIAAVGGAPSR